MLIGVILLCEVLFWVYLLGGLAARYVLRRARLGAVLLLCAPLVDLILLVATVVDLRAGGTATVAHTLAGVYLGFSVGFGHHLVSRADARFAHRFAGGPPPTPKPRGGAERAAYQGRGWLRHLTAYGVGVGLMMLAVVAIDDASRTGEFLDTARWWTALLVVDGLVALGYRLWPRDDPAQAQPSAETRQPGQTDRA